MNPPPTDPALLADWATILASEAAAVATDREMQEAVLRVARALDAAGQATADAVRRARAHAPAGAAAAVAAPAAGGRDTDDGGAAELAELRRRVSDLERRLAERG